MVLKNIKLHYLMWMISIAFTIIVILNVHSSYLTKDYECVPGKIEDVTETKELTKKGYEVRYNYVITWYRDGQYFKRAVHEAFSAPDESITKVWVNDDNTDAIVSNVSKTRRETLFMGGIAIVCFIVGVLSSRTSRKKSPPNKETLESLYYSLIVSSITMLVGVAIVVIVLSVANTEGYYCSPVIKDLIAIFALGFVASVVGARKIKHRL